MRLRVNAKAFSMNDSAKRAAAFDRARLVLKYQEPFASRGTVPLKVNPTTQAVNPLASGNSGIGGRNCLRAQR
jgi:hypothetical protein